MPNLVLVAQSLWFKLLYYKTIASCKAEFFSVKQTKKQANKQTKKDCRHESHDCIKNNFNLDFNSRINSAENHNNTFFFFSSLLMVYLI